METFTPRRSVNTYQVPTVSKLADFLSQHENHPDEAATIARILLQIESIPSKEIEMVLEERTGHRNRA